MLRRVRLAVKAGTAVTAAFAALVSVVFGWVTAVYAQTPAVQDEFRPLNELPPGQELPAAPFLVGAYSFFLVLMVLYVWSIGKRLGKVKADIQALEQRSASHTRSR